MELTHRYAFPDRFVSGAVGGPERRVFFIQTRQGSRMTNVVCERAQIKVLAEHLQRVLAELDRASARPGRPSPRPVDDEPLDVPLDEDFRAGTMAITWLPEQASLSVELYALGSYHELARLGRPAPNSNVLEVVISLDQARDFVARTEHLLVAQAPACPFCAQPVGGRGHLCPRSNGYRKSLIDLAG